MRLRLTILERIWALLGQWRRGGLRLSAKVDTPVGDGETESEAFVDMGSVTEQFVFLFGDLRDYSLWGEGGCITATSGLSREGGAGSDIGGGAGEAPDAWGARPSAS